MSTGSRPTVIFPPRIVDQLIRADVDGVYGTGLADTFKFEKQKDLEFLAKKWIELYAKGKLDQREETPLYNEFITKFFIEILGYVQATGTDDEFHTLRITKGKRGAAGIPDLSLGFFDLSAKREDVLAVAEIKAWGKGLTNPVHSKDQIMQLMGYMFGYDCDWGIATNIQEWRLYHRTKASRYQRWTIEELAGSDPEPRKSFHALLARKHLIGRAPGQPAPVTEYLAKVGAEQEAITKEFYGVYRDIRANCLAMLRERNPEVPAETLIEQTQKLLDRLLFVCFAEDHDLLPDHILKSRLTDNLRMVEQPQLENLRELFRGIDQGWKMGKSGDIPAYNGGLFAFDPLLDRDLRLTEDVAVWALRLANWDYYNAVGPDLLGHVFEQSITDLEQLRSEAKGEEVSKKDSKRKREGVFYTPDYVTEYIVRQTVGVCVQKAQAESLERLGLTDTMLDADTSPATRELWRQHLLNLRDAIVRLRIVDPACGSGAFLIAAYKFLKDFLDLIAEKLRDLMPESELALFVPEDHLLSRCLFGVDLNAESVEITKLSLWIKTARHGERLHLLDRNIYKGNSLIADHDVDSRAFDWDKGFVEVMAEGGFDCVIGNPPYVRQGRIAGREYLAEKYSSHDGDADLYVYFYERGLKLLKPGGRLGYISGGSFFRGGFGTPLRRYLREQAAVEQIINFGDYRVFPDAEMVDPSILILSKSAKEKTVDPPTRVWVNHNKKSLPEGGIGGILERAGFEVPESSLADTQWHLAPLATRDLSEKLFARGAPLAKVSGGQIYRGVLTGLNRTEGVKGEGVFVIDRTRRDQLISEDSRSAELLKPMLEGKDIKTWRLEPQDRWLVFARRGVNIERYPAIQRHLSAHRARLEPKPEGWKPEKPGERWGGRKAGDYTWYELQDTIAYYEAFEHPKIVWPDIAKVPRFNRDDSGLYLSNTGYIMPSSSWFLLGFLNSNANWVALAGLSQPLGQRAGLFRYRLIYQFVSSLPIPTPTPADERIIAACAEELSDLGARRYAVIRDVRHRLYSDYVQPYAAMTGRSQKLDAWHTLDFSALQGELKKRTKREIPHKERTPLENYLAEERRQVVDMAGQMSRLEDQLNDAVNRAFGLTVEECAIVNRVLDPVGSGAEDEGDDED